MKNLTDYLGFYFVMFQRDISNTFVRCWIDGSEDCEFMFREDFYKLFEKEKDPKVLLKAKDALTESSIFLWDVDNGTINRLNAAHSEPSDIREKLNQRIADSFKEQNSSSDNLLTQIASDLNSSFKKLFNLEKK